MEQSKKFCQETWGPGSHVTLTRTIYLNTVADKVHAFMANSISYWQYSLSAGSCSLSKLFRNGLRMMSMSSRCWTAISLHIPLISIWSCIGLTCCTNKSELLGARSDSTPSEVLWTPNMLHNIRWVIWFFVYCPRIWLINVKIFWIATMHRCGSDVVGGIQFRNLGGGGE